MWKGKKAPVHNLGECSQNPGQDTFLQGEGRLMLMDFFPCPGCSGVVTHRAVIRPDMWDLALLLSATSPQIFRVLGSVKALLCLPASLWQEQALLPCPQLQHCTSELQ